MFHSSGFAIRSCRLRLRDNVCFFAVVAVLLFVGLPRSNAFAQSPPTEEADVLIKGGHVIDGTGGPWMLADVAIKGDRIVYVGRAPVKAKRVIDATGNVVTPGFFDMHAHSEFGLSLDGRGLSMVTQGVTTEVLGEHLSAGPVLGPAVDDPMMITPPVKRTWTTLGGFFSFLEKKGIGLNIVSYVGAGQVRASVMGYENRTPTAAEMDQMKKLIAQAMEEGAFGLSAGLVYVPNSFDTTEQMIEFAKVAASYGGIYSVHMRDGGETGLLETFKIAQGANIPVEIFHLGGAIARDPKFVPLIEKARSEGIDVTCNAYPYTVGWTYVRQLLPVWAQAGDAAAITARLKQPEVRARVVKELHADPRPFAQYRLSSANLEYDGHTLQQIADSNAYLGRRGDGRFSDRSRRRRAFRLGRRTRAWMRAWRWRSRIRGWMWGRTGLRFRQACIRRSGIRIRVRLARIRGCWRSMFVSSMC